MYKLIKKNILPIGSRYAGELCKSAADKRAFLAKADCTYERETSKRLTELTDSLHRSVNELFVELCAAEDIKDLQKRANHYKNSVLSKMGQVREHTDEMELLVSRAHWPFPTYGDLLFSVR